MERRKNRSILRLRRVTSLLLGLIAGMPALLWSGSSSANGAVESVFEGASENSGRPSEQYAVPVTPAIYLVNFVFLYSASPEIAKYMPAYRAPLPPELLTCLEEHPEDCYWEEYKQYFETHAQGLDDATHVAGRAIARCKARGSAWHPASTGLLTR